MYHPTEVTRNEHQISCCTVCTDNRSGNYRRCLTFVDQNDSDESYAIVVTDDAGKEIKLREPLERVAVVNSNITLT